MLIEVSVGCVIVFSIVCGVLYLLFGIRRKLSIEELLYQNVYFLHGMKQYKVRVVRVARKHSKHRMDDAEDCYRVKIMYFGQPVKFDYISINDRRCLESVKFNAKQYVAFVNWMGEYCMGLSYR